MKKFLCLILCLSLLICFAGCSDADSDKEYNVTVINEEYLVRPLKPSYRAGRTVSVRTEIPEDPDAVFTVYLDEVPLERKQGYSNVDYWEYKFTMPKHDVILKFEQTDEFYNEYAGTKIDCNVEYYNFSGYTISNYETVITSLEEWVSISDLFRGFESDYDEQFFDENALIVFGGTKATMGGSVINVKMVKTESADDTPNLIIKLNCDNGAYQAVSGWALIIKVKNSDITNCNINLITNLNYYTDYNF